MEPISIGIATTNQILGLRQDAKVIPSVIGTITVDVVNIRVGILTRYPLPNHAMLPTIAGRDPDVTISSESRGEPGPFPGERPIFPSQKTRFRHIIKPFMELVSG